MTTIARRSTITRVTAVSITLLLGAGIIGACSSDDDKTTTSAQGTSTTAQGSSPANQLVNVKDVKPVNLPLALNEGVPAGTKIGLLVSGTGPGNDLFGQATGAYIAAFRLNGAKGSGSDTVKLIVKDDGSGDPAAATAAMQDLISQGVAGVVYASTGDQMVPAVQAAAQAGVPVLVPYSGDTRLMASGTTTYLTGPTDGQVAAKLVKMAAARNLSKIGVLHQAGSYGDAGLAAVTAAGVTPVKDAAFATSDPEVKKQVDELIAAGSDSLIVWADGAETAKVTNAVAGNATPVPIFFASRAATPAFGRLQNTLLAPTASDGMISAGTWAGAWTPTQQVDTFFAAKPLAVSDGGVITDLGFADIRSHDAVVAIAFAAKAANSNSASGVLTALKSLKLDAASTPLDFSKQAALTDGNVAALSYSTVDDGSGRYPEFATAGGHWVAVDGSYTFPDSLKGLDNAYGG